MSKTANSIIRTESWDKMSVSVPPALAKKYKKALIDCDVSSRQAFMAFIHAVACGEFRLEPKRGSEKQPERGFSFDTSGVFDEYRLLIKDSSGRVLNPMPFLNEFIEKI